MSHYYVHTTMCTLYCILCAHHYVHTLWKGATEQHERPARSKASDRNPPSPSKLPRKNTLKSPSHTEPWQLYRRPSFYWGQCMNFTQHPHDQYFSFGPGLATLPPVRISGQKCLWNLHTGHWDGRQHGTVLDWCVKRREAKTAVTLCSSHKYHVSRGPRLCIVLRTKVPPPPRPCKSVFHLSKSVRQKWYLVLTVIFFY